MKNKLSGIVLQWGALLGVGLAIIHYFRNITAEWDFYSFGPVIDLLMILLFIGGLYLGIKTHKDYAGDKGLSFPKAFLTGVLISLVSFFLFFLYLIVNYSWSSSENVFESAFFTSLSFLIYGILFSFFVALFLYKKKSLPDSEEETIFENDNQDFEN